MKVKLLKILISATVVFLSFNLAACSNNSGQQNDDSGKPTIRVGSKDFTESLIVGEIYALALEDAGYSVNRMLNLAGSIVHTSIVNDEIDLYPEYTGTGLLSVLQMDLVTDPQEVYEIVKQEYKNQFQITWLELSSANDGQGLVIRTDIAEALGIKTISDLQKHAPELRFASQGEFDQREDGMPGLIRVYGPFEWKSSKVYDNGLKYQVLSSNEADVTPAYTTEGQLVNKEFTLLEDDKQVWPPYNLVPIVRDNILDENGEIAEILNEISAILDTETLTALNAKVDVDKMEYDEVALEFFQSIR